MSEDIKAIKVALIGEVGVGKTSIITQFVDEDFQEFVQSNTGGIFSVKTGKNENGERIKFEIWDTAGQERYRALAKM